MPVVDITRKLGISEATFYVWKIRFGTLGSPEIRELRQLRDAALELTELDAGDVFRLAVRRELKRRPNSIFSVRARLVA